MNISISAFYGERKKSDSYTAGVPLFPNNGITGVSPNSWINFFSSKGSPDPVVFLKPSRSDVINSRFAKAGEQGERFRHGSRPRDPGWRLAAAEAAVSSAPAFR